MPVSAGERGERTMKPSGATAFVCRGSVNGTFAPSWIIASGKFVRILPQCALAPRCPVCLREALCTA